MTILALAFTGILLLGLLIVLGSAVILVKRSGHEKERGTSNVEILREINHGLERMDKRIEALETILLEPKKEAEKRL